MKMEMLDCVAITPFFGDPMTTTNADCEGDVGTMGCENHKSNQKVYDTLGSGAKYEWSMVQHHVTSTGEVRWEKKLMFSGSSAEYGVEGLGQEVSSWFVDEHLNHGGTESAFACRLVASMVYDEMYATGLENSFLFTENSTVVQFFSESGDITLVGCFEGLEGGPGRRVRALLDSVLVEDGDEERCRFIATLDDHSLPCKQIELGISEPSRSGRLVKMYLGELWKCAFYRAVKTSEDSRRISHFSNDVGTGKEIVCAVKWVRNSRLQHNSHHGGSRHLSPTVSVSSEPLNEIKIMQYLQAFPSQQRRGLAQLVDVIRSDLLLGIVMPFYKDGDLFEYLMGNPKQWTEQHAVSAFYKICLGVQSLHGAGVCHRDLSAENVLLILNESRQILDCVMTDFGQSIIVSGSREKVSGVRSSFSMSSAVMSPVSPMSVVSAVSEEDASPAFGCNSLLLLPNEKTYKKMYRPPELVDEQLINKYKFVDYYRADLWALGVIFYFLLTRNLPFDEESWSGQQNWFEVVKNKSLGEKLVQTYELSASSKRFQVVSKPLRGLVSNESAAVLSKLLSYDPSDRPASIEEVLSTSLFESVGSPSCTLVAS
jgi:serine/threonine protein kinase